MIIWNIAMSLNFFVLVVGLLDWCADDFVWGFVGVLQQWGVRAYGVLVDRDVLMFDGTWNCKQLIYNQQKVGWKLVIKLMKMVS